MTRYTEWIPYDADVTVSSPEELADACRKRELGIVVITGCDERSFVDIDLPHTTNIELYKCNNIVLPASLPSLTTFDADYCTNVVFPKHVPDLENIKIMGSASMRRAVLKDMPDSVTDLNIRADQELQCFVCPEQIQWLRLYECPLLTKVAAAARMVPSLSYVTLSDCPNLASIPPSMPSLDSFKASNLGSLKALPTHAPQLTEVVLKNCPRLESLPQHAPRLQYVQATGCEAISTFPTYTPRLYFLDIKRPLAHGFPQD